MAGNIMNLKNEVNMKWIYGIIGFVLLNFACEDNRLSDMVDDKIYLLNAGEKIVNVVNWPDVPFELIAIKSGMGNQNGVIQLISDRSILDDYNEIGRASCRERG